MKKNKDEEIKVRVTAAMKSDVNALAEERGETEALITRKALAEYLAKNPPQTKGAKEAARLAAEEVARSHAR